MAEVMKSSQRACICFTSICCVLYGPCIGYRSGIQATRDKHIYNNLSLLHERRKEEHEQRNN